MLADVLGGVEGVPDRFLDALSEDGFNDCFVSEESEECAPDEGDPE